MAYGGKTGGVGMLIRQVNILNFISCYVTKLVT